MSEGVEIIEDRLKPRQGATLSSSGTRYNHNKQGVAPADNNHLASAAMDATRECLVLCAKVMKFDVVELWVDQGTETLSCIYAYATPETRQIFSDVLEGPNPRSRPHSMSPRLCDLAKMSPSRYYFSVSEPSGNGRSPGGPNSNASFPSVTRMAFHLDYKAEDVSIFICAFASRPLEMSSFKFKFLTGLGYAIYVAAFDFDEEDNASDIIGNSREPDRKKPAELLSTSTEDIASLSVVDGSIKEGQGQWGLSPKSDETADGSSDGSRRSSASTYPRNKHSIMMVPSPKGVSIMTSDTPPNPPLTRGVTKAKVSYGYNSAFTPPSDRGEGEQFFSDASTTRSSREVTGAHPTSTASVTLEQRSLDIGEVPRLVGDYNSMSSGIESHLSHETEEEERYCAPSWEPQYPFSFPVTKIPVHFTPFSDLNLHEVKHLRKMGEGSNSDIYMGEIEEGHRVVIKMIKERAMCNPVAVHEFEVEHGVLARVSHPNILRLLGAGTDPQKFFVLEFLGKGTLQSLLNKSNNDNPNFASRLFRKPSFTYKLLLSNALDIANALNYLHNCVHMDACIIHRDIKPDNIGFASDGCLKILDFGLCTVVKKGKTKDDAYKMTGNTGSLRYMAPEVVLRKPYNSSVDVYSFGIMLWQMARDQVPFRGLTKELFVKEVVLGGVRPKVDKNWPPGFTSMLISCWHVDPTKRPTFAEIQERLRDLIKEDLLKNANVSAQADAEGGSMSKPVKKKSSIRSTWF